MIAAVILLSGILSAQSRTNLDVFYNLNDSLTAKIINELPKNHKKILLRLNLGSSYSVFSNHIKNSFIKNGFEILEIPPDELNIPEVNIVMEDAAVEYGEMNRDGWFGDYFTERKAHISGNYLQSFSEHGLQKFNITSIDTIKVDEIKQLENDSFPFMKGALPPEPFLSSLWEPVIAIGVAALAVILFFSVRSK